VIGDLKLLTDLNVSHTGIKELPEAIGGCTLLKILNLSFCRSLESLPDGLWQLDIKDLNLSDCKSLDMDSTLEKIALNFKNIEKLNIAGTNVTVLTEAIGDLKSLTVLDVSYTFIKELPGGIGELTNLKSLTMYGCPANGNIPGVLKEKIQAQGCKIAK